MALLYTMVKFVVEDEMMRIPKLLMFCAAFIMCCLSITFADEGKDESGKGRESKSYEQCRHDGGGSSYFHRHGYTHLNIPKGHYPSPGECRIWYPNRPAGHQPPPGKCSRLRSQVPPGAWLIRHPEDKSDHVLVDVYDKRRPGLILVTGEFEMGTGVFVRIVINK
jgi:hypothetical protein